MRSHRPSVHKLLKATGLKQLKGKAVKCKSKLMQYRCDDKYCGVRIESYDLIVVPLDWRVCSRCRKMINKILFLKAIKQARLIKV